jgi:hypothetical protein
MTVHGNDRGIRSGNMAISLGSELGLVAENIVPGDAHVIAKRTGGRQSPIKDEALWGVRNHLVWLVETTWPDVGGKLAGVKTVADLESALDNWRKERSQEPIVELLLRSSASPATAKVLNERRRQLNDLSKSGRKAWAYREKCRESLEVAKRALGSQLTDDEKAVVEEQIAKRAERFAEAEAKYNAAKSREERMDQSLKDGETYFTRAEFVRFLKSRRYRLTPLNVADALAGLPLIGWRHSVKRCKTKACQGINGGAMQVFDTIRRIVQSCTRRSELARHAERWLKTHKDKSYGPSELRKDWYYLRWSIKTVLETSPRVPSRDLPYAIAREYRRRKYQPSNVDLLFAEEEGIAN